MKDYLKYHQNQLKTLLIPAPQSDVKEKRDDEKIEMDQWERDIQGLKMRIENAKNEVNQLIEQLHSNMPW